MPRPEDQPREPPSSFSSGKLILPQDRYTRRVNDAGSDKEKRKRKLSLDLFLRAVKAKVISGDDKWSRFENSSSESSSSSSTSPTSSDAESDAEEEPSKRSSDDGASDGSAGEEEAR